MWAFDEPERLPHVVRDALLDARYELCASVVSLWEIAAKVQKGKLATQLELLEGRLREIGISRYVPVELAHVRQLSRLPPIHNDPFDRMLVAQAVVEGLTLVTGDAALRQYPVPLLW